jgi:DNA-binding FadR family transcriptional regulator
LIENASTASAERIDPVHHTAAYELVVDQIRRVIYLGRFLPGDKLPPERELAQQLGVSRTTVREAIRLLEGEKLITVKRGATGGIIVSSPNKKTATEKRNILAAHAQELQDIFEYRLAIECYTVRRAAERRTQQDIDYLTNMMSLMEQIAVLIDEGKSSVAEYSAADTRFHIGIATASKNARMEAAIEEIRAAMFLPVGSIFEKLTDKINEHHRPIVEAIIAQDPDEAERNMRDHIQLGFDGLKSFLGKNARTNKSR